MSEQPREWKVGIRVSSIGIKAQYVYCVPNSIPPFLVTNFPNKVSEKVANELADALNKLEQYRFSVYGCVVATSP